MAELTAAARKRLPDSAFAIPEDRAYPIHDREHASNALSRVTQHGTPEEKRRVRAAVDRRYPGLREAAHGAVVTDELKEAQDGARVTDISQAKACQILEEGQASGEPLTPAQQRFFGAVCSGQAPRRADSGALVVPEGYRLALSDLVMENPSLTIG